MSLPCDRTQKQSHQARGEIMQVTLHLNINVHRLVVYVNVLILENYHIDRVKIGVINS